MKATEQKLLDLLLGPKQFILPIYQREYGWNEKHCKQLLEDIIRVGQNEKLSSYFLGPIVSKSVGGPALAQYLVVDGQQRLTTLLLLLSALGEAIEVNTDEINVSKKEIEATYVFNMERTDGEDRYKLLLT